MLAALPSRSGAPPNVEARGDSPVVLTSKTHGKIIDTLRPDDARLLSTLQLDHALEQAQHMRQHKNLLPARERLEMRAAANREARQGHGGREQKRPSDAPEDKPMQFI